MIIKGGGSSTFATRRTIGCGYVAFSPGFRGTIQTLFALKRMKSVEQSNSRGLTLRSSDLRKLETPEHPKYQLLSEIDVSCCVYQRMVPPVWISFR